MTLIHPSTQRPVPPGRRGVILLVCLGMLVLFTLTALMFVIAARQHKATSRAQSRVESYDDGFEELLKRMARQLLSGTNNPHSVVRPHGLLEDRYGNDSLPVLGDNTPLLVARADKIRGNIPNGANNVDSGLVQIVVQDSATPIRLNQQNGYYNGRVLTVLDPAPNNPSPARLQSTRIIGYSFSTTNNVGVFQVLAFANGQTPRQGDFLLINGREFNGTGFGYNRAAYPDRGRTNAADPNGVPYALAPNPVAFADNAGYGGSAANPDPAGLGGADEGIDVPDFNDMALAARMWNPDPNLDGDTSDGRWEVKVPSFYRPALVNYWAHQLANAGVRASDDPKAYAQFVRKFILRPLRELNKDAASSGRPPFDGGNLFLSRALEDLTADHNGNNTPDHVDAFNNLLWDVDNDGDGLADSIWIDAGMPVQTSADGRLFKPLFAVMVLDMDGRLNLNAHGTPNNVVFRSGVHQIPIDASTIPPQYNQFVSPQFTGPRPYADGQNPPRNASTQNNRWASLPMGQGYSPAAVNLGRVFSKMEYRELLFGRAATGNRPPIDGRYGEVDIPISGRGLPLPGQTDNRRDAWDFVNHPGFPDPVRRGVFGATGRWAAVTLDGAFGAATGFAELGVVGLDKNGHPIRLGMGAAFDLESQLQMDVFRGEYYFDNSGDKVRMDAPFTMRELEAVLRRWDVDAQSLSGRLAELVPGLVINANDTQRLRQGIVTAESYDPPTFTPRATSEIRREFNGNETGLHIVDLVRAKMRSEAQLRGTPLPPNYDFNPALRSLLPPSMVNGVRMDVNLPIGNGMDENSPGVPNTLGGGTVDEPGEMTGRIWWGAPGGSLQNTEYPRDQARFLPFASVRTDHDNDGQFSMNDRLARQRVAKYLYVLMMMLKDRGYQFPTSTNDGNGPYPDPFRGGTGTVNKRELTARRIAQWAINAVDFRDPDSIMTHFEFDFEPFVDNDGNGDPWDVDGWIGPSPLPPGNNDDSQPHRGLVWGCERPQLVISETMAFHDLRTKDTEDEGGAGMGAFVGMNVDDDDDFDQVRRPQGTLLFELHNPNYEPVPAELRSIALPNKDAVDLSRMVSASGDPNAPPLQQERHPVWQVVVNSGLPDLQNRPDTDPVHVDLNRAERIVWFTSPAEYGKRPDTVDSRIYYSDLKQWNNGAMPLQKDFENRVEFNSGAAGTEVMWHIGQGGYSVVGPRVMTRIGRSGPVGSVNNLKTIRLLDESLGSPRAPRDIRANQWSRGRLVSDTYPNTQDVGVEYPNWGDRNGPSLIKRPMGIVINMPNRGISVSEPGPGAQYYAGPTKTVDDLDDDSIKYADGYANPPDQPFDLGLQTRGTRTNHSTVYLQRLANPMFPWHPDKNPYITVDYAPVDLTVFNGEDDGATADPLNQNPPPQRFTTRERIGRRNAATTLTYDIWSAAFSTSRNRARHHFEHSLGFISGLLNRDPNQGHQRGRFLAHPNGLPGNIHSVWTSTDYPAGSPYIGAPRRGTFPWFTWNNRPYVSHLELLNVPASSPSRLLHEFTLRDANNYADHYAERAPGTNAQGAPTSGPPFGHLLNFFASSDPYEPPGMTPPPWDTAGQAKSNFHRLFEFVRVPSRYRGTRQFFNAQLFAGQRLIDPISGAPGMQHAYHPPFNWFSNFRDPGRVNINTIFDNGTTWAAVMNNDTTNRMMAHWRNVFLSRQGYGLPNDPMPKLDARSPTLFADPFRPFGSRYNVPMNALSNRPVNGRPDDRAPGTPGVTPRTFVESTLLRPDPINPRRPLFAAQSLVDASFSGAVGAGNATTAYRNGDRSPHFRYSTLHKLGNVLTTRSNMYAAWITVGYFEVSPSLYRDPNDPTNLNKTPPRTLYPDGYVLGPELGADTGEIVRHRAFFVFNRNTPVAFRRGEDYNTKNAIVLERIIE